MEKPIKTYSLTELDAIMKSLGQPSFRAKQLSQWLYKYNVSSFDEMTNLPKSLRATLSEFFPLYSPRIVQRLVSRDLTRKYLIEYHDGVLVETVAIPSHDGQRLTVCFSTQAGCPMGCAFCATGREGLTRSLSPGEIVDQVFVVQKDMEMSVTNLVGMGQGEPFLNYDNVLGALKIFNSPDHFSIGARHITVSTCGIVPGINRFAMEKEQFTLAISLHAARQDVRDVLMPKVASFDLETLKSSLSSYTTITNRRITLEYIMLSGVNDTSDDLKALQIFCSDLLCHVNLIPLNKVEGSFLSPSSTRTIEYWKHHLCERGVETTVRESRGSDIQGACGQLKNSAIVSRETSF